MVIVRNPSYKEGKTYTVNLVITYNYFVFKSYFT